MSWDLAISNGDLTLNNGDLATLSGQDKLVQDILKICLTPVGANIYQPFYGSLLSKTLIGMPFDTEITVGIAQSQLQNALENLKKLQQLQLSNIMQQITPNEHIAGITDIKVERNSIDPRIFNITVRILSRAFQRSTITFSP